METAEDYRSIQQDCEQLTRLGCNGDHTAKQIVRSMSNVRCEWYKKHGLPPRQPAPRYELEPSYDIALQYENALREFPDYGLIYDSYQCLIADCVAQYNMITQYITCIPSENHYESSDSMRADLQQGVLYYLPTITTWEQEDIEKGYYMYQLVPTSTGLMIANDVFRIVHDAFSHSAGFSFNSYGEYFAWWIHRDAVQPLARYALFCETRAQNNWTNILPHHAVLAPAQRPFPAPKAVLYDKSLI